MALPIVGVILSVGGQVLSSIVSAFISALSQKVIIKIIVKLIDRLVASSKNDLDDSLWPDFKEALLKQVAEK